MRMKLQALEPFQLLRDTCGNSQPSHGQSGPEESRADALTIMSFSW